MNTYYNVRDIPQGQSRTYYTRGTCPCGSHYARGHVSGYVKWVVRKTARGCSCTLKRINISFNELPKAERQVRS